MVSANQLPYLPKVGWNNKGKSRNNDITHMHNAFYNVGKVVEMDKLDEVAYNMCRAVCLVEEGLAIPIEFK